MNKISTKIILFTLGGLLAFFSIGYILSSNSIRQIPQFDYIEISTNKHFTSKHLKNRNKKVFIYFSPSCDDCHEVIDRIRKNKSKLGNAQILMVSKRPVESLVQYMIDNDIKNLNNTVILYDANNKFVQDFHLGSFVPLPTILIFNSENELIFKGSDMNFIENL